MAAFKKPLLIGAVFVLAATAGFFAYLELAFPKVRCEAAKHLTAPETLSDCYTCHGKATPALAQDWKDSKHGAMLVKCVVCHGQPDGQGSIPFAAKPGIKVICVRCHEPAINRMVDKFGELTDCESCHPRHQNPMHRNAYEPVVATDKTDL
jgi:cytochrome c553